MVSGVTPQAISILVADDHEPVRRSLSYMIDCIDGFTLLSTATNGADAARLCAELQPDVVLMDLKMPGLNGVEAIAQIHREHPQIKTIAYTFLKMPSLKPPPCVPGRLPVCTKALHYKNSFVPFIAP